MIYESHYDIKALLGDCDECQPDHQHGYADVSA